MVLRLKTRESRSLPGLQSARHITTNHTNKTLHKHKQNTKQPSEREISGGLFVAIDKRTTERERDRTGPGPGTGGRQGQTKRGSRDREDKLVRDVTTGKTSPRRQIAQERDDSEARRGCPAGWAICACARPSGGSPPSPKASRKGYCLDPRSRRSR